MIKLTRDQLQFLNNSVLGVWGVNDSDGSVNVDGDILMPMGVSDINSLPVKFGKVSGKVLFLENQSETKKLNDYQVYFVSKVVKGEWKLNTETGLVDVDGNVDLTEFQELGIFAIPVIFGEVTGHNDFNKCVTNTPNGFIISNPRDVIKLKDRYLYEQ